MRNARRSAVIAGAAALLTAAIAIPVAHRASSASADPGDAVSTATPIKHMVVLFQENVSFDHYFGTYPNAANPKGEPEIDPRSGTPTVNGLSPALLQANPNLSNPHRLDRSEALICDQNHEYTDEQTAADHGALDRFVQATNNGAPAKPLTRGECDIPKKAATAGDYPVMDYYDGNTVTAMWNYAQHFAMNDNSFQTGFGPSTPGVFDLVAGNTFGALCGPPDSVYQPPADCTAAPGTVAATPGQAHAPGTGTTYSDSDPNFDVCSKGTTIQMGGENVGHRLSAKGITWGWFQGGFASPGYTPGQPSSDDLSKVCTGGHYNIGAGTSDGQACDKSATTDPLHSFCVADYSAHHQPFEYYQSTANPKHLPPTSIDKIGRDDQANHQYDLADFWAAADEGNLPSVSYLKAAKFQDGHAAYSDPLDEQTFVVTTINRLQRLKEWKSTAVVIAYDDSDGFYDHVLGPIVFQSQTALDTLTGASQCGTAADRVPQDQQARCGYGPRLPLLVISRYARDNFVDHSLTDQSSVLQFIEDNWHLQRIGGGSSDELASTMAHMFTFDDPRSTQDTLILDPATGLRTD